MEDVLEVYHRPHDPACPVVCVDETSKQLSVETRKPIPAKPGRPARYDYERNGTANLFMMFAPLEGWRKVRVIRYKIHAVENRADSNAAQGMVPGETVPQTSRCPTLMQPWRGCPR